MSQDSHTQSPISQIGDMLDDGLILTNLDGVIRSANPAAVRWFGENLTGQMIFDVINHPNIGDLFAKAADGAKRCEMRYEPTNIIQREFRMRLQRIGDQSVALLFLDMTLQRNLEKVRRDFVANVSHELRTPLTSLMGFIETLQGPAKDDAGARMQFLEIMSSEAARMERLVSDLLSLSRVEAEERLPLRDSVALGALLTSVISSLAPRASETAVEIMTDLSEHDLSVRAEADQLRQVFTNLIENAIKYGGAGGKVFVTLSAVEGQPALRGQPGVLVKVKDFGAGIDPLHIPRLTERFYRVDSHRSRQVGGTGLGLAIVKHIVQRHRGRLRIDSDLGKGAEFSVLLPRGDAV